MILFLDSSDPDFDSGMKDMKTVTLNCSVAYMAPCLTMNKWYDFMNFQEIQMY